MACCGKSGGCNKQPHDLPADNMFGSLTGLSADLVAKLLQVAAGGLRANTILRQFEFADKELSILGKQIADMAIENEYLKKVTNLFAPVSVTNTADSVEIFFGPRNEYLLKVPLGDKASRQNIAAQLRAAADKIETNVQPSVENQHVFPFVFRTSRE